MTIEPSMEPMIPPPDGELDDLVLVLVAKASAFAAGLNPPLRRSLGDLVRSMNCYYSNLIEGHATHLVDIERAMQGDYSEEPEKRNLQLEAKAHIEVQRMIDQGEMPSPPVSENAIRWIHREFCSRLPPELLEMKDPATGAPIRMDPGEFRRYHVKVGLHEAPDPAALPHLLWRFVDAYNSRMLTRLRRIEAIPAAHHRLAWIHPFIDGNGRVARLLSHAMLRDMGVGSELWSISRGLARRVGEYKARLQAADEPRRGDRDGRGALTESGLRAFCHFFLEVCIDQVEFMQTLVDPVDLQGRIKIWTEEEIRARRLFPGSWQLIREAIQTGEFHRSGAAELTGYGERQGRTILSHLIKRGLLVSDTPKGPVRLGFPASTVERWLPGLYAPQGGSRNDALASERADEEPTHVGKVLEQMIRDKDWQIPENFHETLEIYADEDAIREMARDLPNAEGLSDLLRRHGVVLPGLDHD